MHKLIFAMVIATVFMVQPAHGQTLDIEASAIQQGTDEYGYGVGVTVAHPADLFGVAHLVASAGSFRHSMDRSELYAVAGIRFPVSNAFVQGQAGYIREKSGIKHRLVYKVTIAYIPGRIGLRSSYVVYTDARPLHSVGLVARF